MSNITLGLLAGAAFGILDALIMLPLKYENKRKKWEAISSASIERFMIGFLVPNLNLGIHPALTGLLVGLSLSLPSAVITRVYAPILGIGAFGGLIIGFIVNVVL